MNEGVPLSPAKLDTIAGRQLFDIRCLIRVGFSRDQDVPMRYRRKHLRTNRSRRLVPPHQGMKNGCIGWWESCSVIATTHTSPLDSGAVSGYGE